MEKLCQISVLNTKRIILKKINVSFIICFRLSKYSICLNAYQVFQGSACVCSRWVKVYYLVHKTFLPGCTSLADLSLLLSIWGVPKGECQGKQPFFCNSLIHACPIPYYKMASCKIWLVWKLDKSLQLASWYFLNIPCIWFQHLHSHWSKNHS